jgi:hypothetical protein
MPTLAEAADGRTRKDPSLYCAQPRASAERIPARLHVLQIGIVLWAFDVVTTEKAERRSTREPKSGCECARRATLKPPRWMFGGWAYRSRWFNRTPDRSGNESTPPRRMPKMWSNTHDASASTEVVVGPKICLYWSRDGLYVAGLRASGAAASPWGTRVLRAGVAIWLA